MKLFWAGMIFVLISGCAEYIAMRDANRSNINKIAVGQTVHDVIAIMGENSSSGTSGTVNNPYKKEVNRGTNGQNYDVFYYYTDHVGNKNWSAGMTPVVFQNGKVAGVGWADFNRLGLNLEAKSESTKITDGPTRQAGTSSSLISDRDISETKTNVSKRYPPVKVTRDNFKKLTKYEGAELNYGDLRSMFLRLSKIDAVTEHSYQFYFVDNYDGGWRFYDSAYDNKGNKLDAISIDRSVGSCSRYSGCSHWEHVGVSVSRDYLLQNIERDFQIKISGRGGRDCF